MQARDRRRPAVARLPPPHSSDFSGRRHAATPIEGSFVAYSLEHLPLRQAVERPEGSGTMADMKTTSLFKDKELRWHCEYNSRSNSKRSPARLICSTDRLCDAQFETFNAARRDDSSLFITASLKLRAILSARGSQPESTSKRRLCVETNDHGGVQLARIRQSPPCQR